MIEPQLVLGWGVPRLRDLPWRRTREPWPILVAEVMLQQTQAARVADRWEDFLRRFPTPVACADASLGDVLRRWQGLGYPRRARNLHAAATLIAERHDGRVPDELDHLLALPGIGPYTARAVLAFAHERDVAVVDTNIARILARAGGGRLTPRQASDLAASLVPTGEGWLWNQVLMDLGATVCRPTPRCDDCPIERSCAWALAGRPTPDPATGSGGVSSAQRPFAGSDREARGAVLRALCDGARPRSEFDPRIVDGLVADGLVDIVGTAVALPS